MNSCDIAIVGGGPAGLSAAHSASRNGLKVVLFEKDKSIAHDIRTSGVSWIDAMKKLGIPTKLYNPIKNYRFVSPNNDIRINGDESKSCILDVRGLYQYLASLAASKGADIFINATVKDVIFSKDNKKITSLIVSHQGRKNEFQCKLVIDASGFNSIIGRKLGYYSKWTRYGVGAEYECYCETLDLDTWTLMVGSQYSPAGYSWIFPISANRARIGVGIGKPESTEDPLELLNQLVNKKLKPIQELGSIQPIEYHSGFIPNQGTRISTVFDGLIVVGDAAGQSNPLVLEGIRHAIEFGRLAGKVGSESLISQDLNLIREYESEWKKIIGNKIQAALKVQTRWMNLSDDEWDKELDILKEMSIDEFLDFITAEFNAKKMMRLAINHPKLIVRQLFSLIVKK